MPNTAVLWIRDGVLINRMPINAAAFALTMWMFSNPKKRPSTTLEDLINFAFEKSGVSCGAKMQAYIAEREAISIDTQQAAQFYDVLASKAGCSANYFNGAAKLLCDLSSVGVRSFITSAVNQNVLDDWSASEQGQVVAPQLCEILGTRENFAKGRDHFEHLKQLGCNEIYYVADAVSEIRTGEQYSKEYNITPVGFANVITAEQVLEAIKVLYEVLTVCNTEGVPFLDTIHGVEINSSKICLPNKRQIEASLQEAGAESIITGTGQSIMQNLRQYFEQQFLLMSADV